MKKIRDYGNHTHTKKIKNQVTLGSGGSFPEEYGQGSFRRETKIQVELPMRQQQREKHGNINKNERRKENQKQYGARCHSSLQQIRIIIPELSFSWPHLIIKAYEVCCFFFQENKQGRQGKFILTKNAAKNSDVCRVFFTVLYRYFQDQKTPSKPYFFLSHSYLRTDSVSFNIKNNQVLMNTFIKQTNTLTLSKKYALLEKSIFRTVSVSERIMISNSSTQFCSSSRSSQYLNGISSFFTCQ